MWLADFSDPLNPDEPHPGAKQGEYNWRWEDPASPNSSGHPDENSCKRCVVFVHGYNTTMDNLREAYLMMKSQYVSANLDVRGIRWAVEKRMTPGSYYEDWRETRNHHVQFLQLMQELRGMYNTVCIQAHSLGTVLVMESLAEDNFPAGLVHRVALHGSDAARFRFTAVPYADEKDFKRWYERLLRRRFKDYTIVSTRVNHVKAWWSANDLVLTTIAKVLRPVNRLGSYGMPPNCPVNFTSIDAQTISKEAVHHNTYKKNAYILADTVNFQGGKLT